MVGKMGSIKIDLEHRPTLIRYKSFQHIGPPSFDPKVSREGGHSASLGWSCVLTQFVWTHSCQADGQTPRSPQLLAVARRGPYVA